MIITVPFFAIAFLLLDMHQFSPTEYQSDWSPGSSEVPSPTGCLRRTGYLRRTGWPMMTGTQSTSHDWNWCIPTSRIFETRIFLSSNFKKMRKYRFYWWSYFVYLFMIEVLNDFGLLKRIYVFWSKRDTVGTGTQSPSLGLELVHPQVFCDSVGTLACPFTFFCPYIRRLNQYFLARFDVDLYLQISIGDFPLFLFWCVQSSLTVDAWFPKPRFEMLQPSSARIGMEREKDGGFVDVYWQTGGRRLPSPSVIMLIRYFTSSECI